VAQKLWNESKEAEKRGKPGKFQILRKPPSAMLALSRPVFDNDHQANDLVGVLPERWSPQGAGWAADNAKGFKTIGISKDEEWLRYRHILRPPDWPAKNDQGRAERIDEIKHREHRPQLITDVLGYNTFEPRRSGFVPSPNWVGDLMLTCKLTVEEPKGEFWMELSKGVDRFQARFDLATGVCSLFRLSEHRTKLVQENGVNKQVPDWRMLPDATAQTRVKAKGEYVIRFANYDDRLTVWVGRDLPFEGRKEADYWPPAQSGPDTKPADENNDLQPASVCSVGAAVQVHGLQLWWDTYDTGFTENSITDADQKLIEGDDWGLPNKWEPLHNLQARTIYVYPSHYLCLGDNSQQSSDSREWGLVPGRLMLGRALMVYFPFERAGTIK